MFKVVLWDYTGESEACAKGYLRDDIRIIRTLRPNDPDQAEVIMRGDYDFVLIFEQGQREFFDEIFKIMQAMNISTKNIIFAKDIYNMLNNPDAVRSLFKPTTDIYNTIQRNTDFFSHKRWYKYISCSVEDLHYVATADDMAIMHNMYVFNRSFASHAIKKFYEWSKKYYKANVSGGGFFSTWARISARRGFISSRSLHLI